MLSFFRTKSTEQQVADITAATENLDMQSTTVDTHLDNNSKDEALITALGYKDTTELRETIYGGFDCYFECNVFNYAFNHVLGFIRYTTDNSRSRKTKHPGRLECCLRGGSVRPGSNQ